jgi:DNA-binding transcriptional LysR family regulator
LNIRQLKCFLSAADTGSFYAAAEQLYISRQAISKSISLLEEEIGQDLFSRNTDGVYLTELGNALYPEIQKVVLEFDALENGMRKLKDHVHRVQVGFCHGTCLLFGNRFQLFSKNHPNIHSEISQYQYEDALEELKAGHADIIVSGYAFRNEELLRRPAYRCPILWGVPEDSPMGQRGFLTREDIFSHKLCFQKGSRFIHPDTALPFIVDADSAKCYPETGHVLSAPDDPSPLFGKNLSYVLDDNMFDLCRLVLQGKAILPIGEALIPAKIEGISFLPCPEHPYYWEIDAYFLRNRPLRECVQELLEEVFTL